LDKLIKEHELESQDEVMWNILIQKCDLLTDYQSKWTNFHFFHIGSLENSTTTIVWHDLTINHKAEELHHKKSVNPNRLVIFNLSDTSLKFWLKIAFLEIFEAVKKALKLWLLPSTWLSSVNAVIGLRLTVEMNNRSIRAPQKRTENMKINLNR
jgi:hypothetical protein